MKRVLRFYLLFLSLFIVSGQMLAEGVGIERSMVCMVNDTYMEKPQIPVAVDDKLYYGCCPGCAERIKTDNTVRHSNDPLTGKQVDKAVAVLRVIDNKVLYFESEESAKKYDKEQKHD